MSANYFANSDSSLFSNRLAYLLIITGSKKFGLKYSSARFQMTYGSETKAARPPKISSIDISIREYYFGFNFSKF